MPGIVILGSKPGAGLPAVAAPVVITANAAAEIALEYRKRYDSRIISLVNSGILKRVSSVQQALARAEPDEIVVLGEKLPDPRGFAETALGLRRTKIECLSFYDRYRLMAMRVGALAPILGLRLDRKSLKHLIKDLPAARTMRWSFASAGLSAVSYAMQRFPDADRYVVAGIGLQGGAHFTGIGSMTAGRGAVDRRVMRKWKRRDRPNLYTTDEAMSRLGDVPLWQGEVFYYDPAQRKSVDSRGDYPE